MPRYYVDIREGDDFTSDDEGYERSTLQAVQEEAAHSLADMVRGAIRKHHNGPTHQMAVEVRNDDEPVLQVKAMFEVERRGQ